MLRRIGARLNYANVVSTAGLFIALATGTAYAANTVFSADIVDGQVKTVDLAGSGVTAAKLANGAVATDKLADGAVTSGKVMNDNLTGGDVAANSIKGADIDESSLIGQVDNCPGGMTMFAQSFCLDAAPRSGGASKSWFDAGALCAANGLRLPTVGEVTYAQYHDGLGDRSVWTDLVYNDSDGNSAGGLNRAVVLNANGNFIVIDADGGAAGVTCAASTSDLF